MAFFTTRPVALLLSLSTALFSAASATYSTISKPPESPVQMDERARDIHYMRVHMAAAASRVELFLATSVPDMLEGPAATMKCQPQCIAVCPNLYRYALDDLKRGLESVEKEDFYMVNVSLTAYITDIDTCDDCIAESERSDECLVEFRKFDCWAKEVGNALVARSIKY